MNKKAKGIGFFSFFVCIVVVAGMAFYYQYMNRPKEIETDKIPSTEQEKLIAKDMEQGYPETPKEVIELYCRMNQCLYKGGLEDDEFDAILKQMRMMYAPEFLAGNSLQQQKDKLKAEIELFRTAKKSILSYTIDSSGLKYKVIHNKECTVVLVAFFLRENNDYTKTYEEFMLSKEGNQWKILGFQQVSGGNTVIKDGSKE